MDDEEWEAIMHFMVFVHPGPGRPTIHGARRALDACFHAACFAGPWKNSPPPSANPIPSTASSAAGPMPACGK
jgi:hypothetical protein